MWVRRFVQFHGRRHPRELGGKEVTAFLSSLANVREVAAATQNQALAALLFLYREVLGVELPWLGEVVRAKRSRRLPTVLTESEVQALLACIHKDVSTTMIYTHVLNRGGRGVVSPLDRAAWIGKGDGL